MIYSKHQVQMLTAHINKFFEKMPAGKLDVVRSEDRRSTDQQSLMHALIREIANHVGVGEGEMKDNILKRNSEGVFPYWPYDLQTTLPKRLSKERPEVLQVVPGLVPKSESKLTKREESELIERLYMLGSEWSVQFSEKVA
jgi:hypothetical protein|tara:strand:- start:1245 stop:1667 length:423 start_codon:yes stop_codon:yes gene_type:complete